MSINTIFNYVYFVNIFDISAEINTFVTFIQNTLTVILQDFVSNLLLYNYLPQLKLKRLVLRLQLKVLLVLKILRLFYNVLNLTQEFPYVP